MGRPPYLDDSFPATKTQGTKECKIPEGSPNRTRSSMRTKRARTHMARMMRLGSCSRSFSACCMGGGYRRQRRRGKEVVTGPEGNHEGCLPLRVGRGGGREEARKGNFRGIPWIPAPSGYGADLSPECREGGHDTQRSPPRMGQQAAPGARGYDAGAAWAYANSSGDSGGSSRMIPPTMLLEAVVPVWIVTSVVRV